MKTKLLLITVFILNSVFLSAQNTKHAITSGKIIFDITYPEAQFDEQTMAMLPKESTMFFKNEKTKVDMSMGMGSTTVISNDKTGESIMLMDIMGTKTMTKLTKEDLESEKAKDNKTKVEKTRESKTIAGYTCYKSIITFETEQGPKSLDIWFTNDIKVKNSPENRIEGIDGFLMEFQADQSGIGMKMTARTVEAKDLEDSVFNIPEGYKEVSKEDLQKMGK